jgi:lipoyl(octanoyl) transferase
MTMAVQVRHESETSALPWCDVQVLGVVPYGRALALQAELVEQRTANRIGDRLLLLEHPHVITLGRDSRSENVLVDADRLTQRGVELHECGRGGDVTYHGPGQLVAYPILDLRPDRCDLRRYVRDLERVLLGVLQRFGVQGHCTPGRTGVWVQARSEAGAAVPGVDAKIAAIGVRVSRWITSHGIALNVHTDLRYFDLIVPCGLAGSAVTSLDRMVHPTPGLAEVGARFAAQFGSVFGRRMRALGKA